MWTPGSSSHPPNGGNNRNAAVSTSQVAVALRHADRQQQSEEEEEEEESGSPPLPGSTGRSVGLAGSGTGGLSKLTPIGKWFLLVVSVECLLLLAIGLFVVIQNAVGQCTDTLGDEIACGAENPTTTYAVIFILTCAFMMYTAVHAVLSENRFELMECVLASGLVTAYAFFRFFARREEANLAISIIQVVVVCFGQAGLVLLAWKLLKQFGFRYLEIVGASQRLQSILRTLEIFKSLLQLDLLIALTLVILQGLLVFSSVGALLGGIFMLLASAAWAIWGWVAMRFEKRRLLQLWLPFALLLPIYLIIKLVELFQNSAYDSIPSPPVFICALISLSCRTLLLMFAIQGMRNFDEGLKQVLDMRAQDAQTSARHEMEAGYGHTLPPEDV